MRVSQHAIARINERNVDPKVIVDVIKNGIKMVNKHDNTKWTFKHKTQDIYAVCTGDLINSSNCLLRQIYYWI